jgi:opacity protein-like surface antigen
MGGFTLGLLFLAATVGSAQRQRGLREVEHSRGGRNSWGSLGFAVAGGTAVGQFSEEVGQNSLGGINANLNLNFNRRGTASLRIDGAYLQYGSENHPLPAGATGGLLAGDMTTSFYVASLRAGPEFVLGTGRVRPYIFGTAGVSYFATETSVGICCGTTNYHDDVTSLAGGGGLRIDLSHSVALDLGAIFVKNGEVNYLREGDILSNSDGSVTLQPVRSEGDAFLLQLGLSFAL